MVYAAHYVSGAYSDVDIVPFLPWECGASSGDVFGVVSPYNDDGYVAALMLGALECDTSAAWVGVRLLTMFFLTALHLVRAWQETDDLDGRELGVDL